jgi:hypothetical protein
VQALTPADSTAASWSVARDGSWLVWHRAASALLNDSLNATELWLKRLDDDGGDEAPLLVSPHPSSDAQLSPDGARVLFSMRSTAFYDFSYTSALFVATVCAGDDSGGGTITAGTIEPVPTTGLPPVSEASSSSLPTGLFTLQFQQVGIYLLWLTIWAPRPQHTVTQACWSASGNVIFAQAVCGVRHVLCVYCACSHP